eukprot:GHVS01056296.1.p1 GENE.GHVS01056296.1~~GHVS01056296.1.p1  ORF type:complete len:610 (-),score=71.80 GHVS01056296.1:139-1968(-)
MFVAPVDEDAMLGIVGEFGWFQKVYMMVVMGLVSVTCGAQTIVMIFAGFHPHRYKLCSDVVGPSEQQLECLKEGPLEVSDCQPYRYLNKSFSIVSEWDLSQCTSPWFSAEVASSIFFFGFLVGVWLFGWISDKLGRRTALCVSCALLQIGGLLICVSPSSLLYCMLRAVIGVGVGGQSIAGYVLAAELVSADYRQLVTLWGSMSFLISSLILCIAVVFTPSSWRSLSFVASIPSIVLLFVWFTKYSIESPRWYATKGRMDEAQAVWQLIASVNRGGTNGTVRSIHQTLPSLPPLERTKALEGGDREGLLDVVYTMPFQMWLAVMISMWFAMSTLYYGGALYVGKTAEQWKGGSEIEGINRLAVTNLWCFAFEAVVVVVALTLADRIGRKRVTVGGLIAGGTSCTIGFLMNALPFEALSRHAASVGRVFAAASFTVAHLYTAELFPTSVRGITVGVSNMGARIAGISAPLLVKLGDYWSAAPLLLFGLLGLASGLAGLLLPETLNRPIRNSLREESARISEAEMIARRMSDPSEDIEVVGRSPSFAATRISTLNRFDKSGHQSPTQSSQITGEDDLSDWSDNSDNAVERRRELSHNSKQTTVKKSGFVVK